MNSKFGEQLQTDFQNSLNELHSLVGQIKEKMAGKKRKTKSTTRNNAPSVAHCPVSSANAKKTNAAADTSSAPPGLLKDSQTVMFANMHDYTGAHLEVSANEHVEAANLFPPLPISPSATSSTTASTPSAASPVPKEPRYVSPGATDAMTTMLSEFSSLRQLLNTRADALENMIKANTMAIAEVKETGIENSNQINAVKVSLDHLYAELVSLKERVDKLESQPCGPTEPSASFLSRISLLENYSRRRNLILYGLEEKDQQDVRRETILMLQKIYPEAKDKISSAVDIVHRLGPKRPGNSKSRPIIIQFAYRHHKEALWRACKDSPFLKTSNLRVSLDFSPEVRERRRLLWPQVDRARRDEKRAYYVGGRAYVDGVEIFPP